jgi:hypothetical protein
MYHGISIEQLVMRVMDSKISDDVRIGIMDSNHAPNVSNCPRLLSYTLVHCDNKGFVTALLPAQNVMSPIKF